jgi:hypothetical protein
MQDIIIFILRTSNLTLSLKVMKLNLKNIKYMKVCNDLHGSSTYGSDWLPLSTDGFVVTMTAAACV